MKVIFLEDVPPIGKAGEAKEVNNGYGRNFLLPRKLAVMATTGNLANMETHLKARAKIAAKTQAEMELLASQLEGKELVFKTKVGEKEKLYGSITGADIAAELEKAGFVIDKKKIELVDTIRQLGTQEITVRLAKDITPRIKVTVVEEEGEKA